MFQLGNYNTPFFHPQNTGTMSDQIYFKRIRSYLLSPRFAIVLVIVGFVSILFLAAPETLLGQEDGGGASAKASDKSLLTWLLGSLGLFYIFVFLSLSFILVAMFILNIMAARRESVCPTPLVEEFENHLDTKNYQEAYDLAKSDDSFLGTVLSAGLARLSSGYQLAVDAMQEAGADESMKMDHRLSYLALIGTLAPMIGLFGTVEGMIRSFYGIAVAGTSPDPNKLAEGISTALLTTLIGLAIAIPAIAGYNILRNLVQRRILEVGITSENLMSRFENLGGESKG